MSRRSDPQTQALHAGATASSDRGGRERPSLRIGRYDADIGRRLREARLGKSYTQDRLAKALDISFQSVQRYEKGAAVGAGRLIEAADALGVSVLSLMRDAVDENGAPSRQRKAGGGVRNETGAALSPEASEAARLIDQLSDMELRQSVLTIVKRLVRQ